MSEGRWELECDRLESALADKTLRLQKTADELHELEERHNKSADRIAELAEAQRPRTTRIGDSVLTRDLVWCECGRGLSLTGKWLYCPNCGGPIDQDSYHASVALAKGNGARLYRDTELVEQLAEAQRYAHMFCVALAKKYPAVPDWRPQDDLLGLLMQIDNMSVGLVTQRDEAQQARDQCRCSKEEATDGQV